ncbi:hypothetical protein F5Y16DRAFT_401904 [Xylariaceae sp. FL0255]|nr:hypothetical protein F5Y16DRAFT_401904 [Xylariaceae sp. FL0255]
MNPSSSSGGTSEWLPTPRKMVKYGKLCLGPAFIILFLFMWSYPGRDYSARAYSDYQAALKIPDPDVRTSEFTNTLEGYKHFSKRCNVSSLELHHPFEPVCSDRMSMLTAMSSGGRIGRNAPYTSRDCDMRWFSTLEACEILNRFSQVILVGDSMLRHVIGALNIIIREDLGYGGVTDWNFNARERQWCFCNTQFDVTECSVQGIYKTEDVIKNDPESLACPRLIPGWSTDLRMEQMVRYPIEKIEHQRLESAIDTGPSSKRKAFILGHGLWNDLEIDKSKAWLNTVITVIEGKMQFRTRLKAPPTDLKRNSRNGNEQQHMPVLLVTPNAAGELKPDEYIVTQGNKALIKFEHAMAREASRLRIDHLGTWNMSIQAHLYDGVHMDMRGNLVKAMMVLNWLDLLEG